MPIYRQSTPDSLDILVVGPISRLYPGRRLGKAGPMRKRMAEDAPEIRLVRYNVPLLAHHYYRVCCILEAALTITTACCNTTSNCGSLGGWGNAFKSIALKICRTWNFRGEAQSACSELRHTHFFLRPTQSRGVVD
jgi:hypothetical protein